MSGAGASADGRGAAAAAAPPVGSGPDAGGAAAPPAGLSGMALVNHRCARKKARYDRCTSDFYQKEFLTGRNMSQADACADRFEAYRQCVLRGIKREVWDKQGLPPPAEGSPLLEVADD